MKKGPENTLVPRTFLFAFGLMGLSAQIPEKSQPSDPDHQTEEEGGHYPGHHANDEGDDRLQDKEEGEIRHG